MSEKIPKKCTRNAKRELPNWKLNEIPNNIYFYINKINFIPFFDAAAKLSAGS